MTSGRRVSVHVFGYYMALMYELLQSPQGHYPDPQRMDLQQSSPMSGHCLPIHGRG